MQSGKLQAYFASCGCAVKGRRNKVVRKRKSLHHLSPRIKRFDCNEFLDHDSSHLESQVYSRSLQILCSATVFVRARPSRTLACCIHPPSPHAASPLPRSPCVVCATSPPTQIAPLSCQMCSLTPVVPCLLHLCLKPPLLGLGLEVVFVRERGAEGGYVRLVYERERKKGTLILSLFFTITKSDLG
jgi:hypothetical protein